MTGIYGSKYKCCKVLVSRNCVGDPLFPYLSQLVGINTEKKMEIRFSGKLSFRCFAHVHYEDANVKIRSIRALQN